MLNAGSIFGLFCTELSRSADLRGLDNKKHYMKKKQRLHRYVLKQYLSTYVAQAGKTSENVSFTESVRGNRSMELPMYETMVLSNV